jgi:hypothetical protein
MAHGTRLDDDGCGDLSAPVVADLPTLVLTAAAALPDVAGAVAYDLIEAFRRQGVDLGKKRNAEVVQATIRVFDDHMIAPLHATGAMDTETYGRVVQALAGLSLAVSDAHLTLNNPDAG